MDWSEIEINDSDDETVDATDNSSTLLGLTVDPEVLHSNILKKATHLGEAISQHTRMLQNSSSSPETHYNQIAQKLDINNFVMEMNGTISGSILSFPLLGCEKDSVSLELGSMEEQKIVRLRIKLEESVHDSDAKKSSYFERKFALPEGNTELHAFWSNNILEIRYS